MNGNGDDNDSDVMMMMRRRTCKNYRTTDDLCFVQV
jgi:hypothetical protein